MKIIFIEYPKCSTCQKAKKWLEINNIQFEDRHIIEETAKAEEIKQWIPLSEKDIKSWFNTSGLKYKELNLKEKFPNWTEKEKISLLSSNEMLIKRPILVNNEKVLIGFKEKEWIENLINK